MLRSFSVQPNFRRGFVEIIKQKENLGNMEVIVGDRSVFHEIFVTFHQVLLRRDYYFPSCFSAIFSAGPHMLRYS